MIDIELKCSCGALTGMAAAVSPAGGNHVVCLCDDCQAYAHYLKRAKDLLDTNGGTEIFQLTPAQLKITTGAQNLRSLRLTKKGLVRWYAGCCNTPIANTMAAAKAPFAGVPVIIMSPERRNEGIGPILARCMGRFGVGTLPEGTSARAPMGLVFRSIKLLLCAWIQGKHQPSPFFSPDGKMVLSPYILSADERRELRSLCGPHRDG